MASRVSAGRPLVALALAACGVFWGGDARADSDVQLMWLAAGTKGATCSIVTPQTCHRFMGNECISSRCDTARAIGDIECLPGSPDCNTCVNNVRQKFDELFNSGYWRQESWRYGWTTRYAPSNLTPESVYDDGTAGDFFGVPVNHVQGFVHTNSTLLPLAMSHSDDAHGSISLIRPNGLSNELHAIHATEAHHPSGMFTLGKYVGFMDGRRILRFIDLNRSLESHRIAYMIPREFEPGPQPVPDPIIDCWNEPELAGAGLCATPTAPVPHSVGTGGGGVAVTRLLGGAYLMVGSEGSERGGNHFLLLEGNLENPSRMRYMGFLEYEGPSQYIASENLSLITECGTGDIYTVHVSGDDLVDYWPVTAGEGHFRLSKISWNNTVDRPVLTYQTGRKIDQDDENCWLRGAGTIYSTPSRGVEAYCHARDENSTGPSRFDYKVLRPTIVVQPPGECPPGEVCIDGLCGEPPLPSC